MVVDRDELLGLDDRALLGACEVDTYRSSGPGGQKRNKTDSAVRLRHGPTGLLVLGTESRSQHVNRARAVRRMRLAIALKVRVEVDLESYEVGPVLAECISGGSVLRVGRKDHRYCRVVAEVLDLVAACGCRVSVAGSKMGITTGNLVSFLQKDAKVWQRINEMRGAVNLKHLRSN